MPSSQSKGRPQGGWARSHDDTFRVTHTTVFKSFFMKHARWTYFYNMVRENLFEFTMSRIATGIFFETDLETAENSVLVGGVAHYYVSVKFWGLKQRSCWAQWWNQHWVQRMPSARCVEWVLISRVLTSNQFLSQSTVCRSTWLLLLVINCKQIPAEWRREESHWTAVLCRQNCDDDQPLYQAYRMQQSQ